MFVSDPDHLAEDAPELVDLGFDPLDEPISWIDFGRMLIAKPVQLKAFLMDQHLIAGIGNIYSDEILYAAGLRYDRMTDTLTTQDIRRLYRAVVEVVHEAVKHRGSSLADEQYRDLFGRVGGYQSEHQAYGREGLACRRCRSTIERAKYQGRSTFYCPSCQV
jgi:formamidopyrimidine-DNA glycosylase